MQPASNDHRREPKEEVLWGGQILASEQHGEAVGALAERNNGEGKL
jgi:hypothetical protein